MVVIPVSRHDDLLHRAATAMGYDSFNDVQKAIIREAFFNNNHTIAFAQTDGGKSSAVIAPLILGHVLHVPEFKRRTMIKSAFHFVHWSAPSMKLRRSMGSIVLL